MTNSTPPPPPNPNQAPTPMNPADEKLWATLVHVGGILFYFVPALIGYIVLKTAARSSGHTPRPH